jgi:hypothetical protein
MQYAEAEAEKGCLSVGSRKEELRGERDGSWFLKL